MTDETQDVNSVEEVETQDNEVVETEEVEADETEDTSPEAENEEPEKTVEERLKELETEVQGKQKAIDRKTAAYTALQKAHDEKMKELQELQQKLSSEPEAKEPNIDDFDTHDEYVNALADYRAEQRVKQKEQEYLQRQQAEATQKAQAERVARVQQQEKEYMEVNPRYEASKNEFNDFLQTMNVSPDVESAVVAQAFEGNVPQVIDYFAGNNGENLDKLAEITNMPPHKAAVEIYKIQQSLGEPKKKEIKPTPKPVKTHSSNAKSNKSFDERARKEGVLKSLGV